MRKTATRSDALDSLVATLESGVCDEAAARQLYTLGPHAVTLALLAAACRITEQNAHIAQLQTRLATGRDPTVVTPSIPSGMQPVESFRPRGRHAGGADEHLPHAASARP